MTRAAAIPDLVAPGARLIDAVTGSVLDGDELRDAVNRAAAGTAALPPGVIFARSGLSVDSVLRYLGAWQTGRPVALLDPALDPATLAELVARFAPAAVVGLAEGGAGASPGGLPPGYAAGSDPVGAASGAWVRVADPVVEPHPDLGVLLATSGSTGNPKLVRLSRWAVHANATGIAEALRIGPDETAPTSLPLFYSYGLSVLNSHLAVGASVLLVDGGVLAREFWQAVDAYRATSLANVPYGYEMLHRIRWTPAKHPSLRTLTQAGGRLRPELVSAFHDKISATGGRMYVMYGQTEATARMTVLPAERLADKLGSAGLPLPGGELSVSDDGEVLYRGPNVMMGYADEAAHLALGDDLGGVLRTGDLGRLDDDGYLWITGRLKRIGKIFGVRVNLDDIERLIREARPDLPGAVAAVPSGDKVVVFTEGEHDDAERAELVKLLAERLKLHRTGFEVRSIEALPTLGSGKVDYRTLEAGT